MRPHGGSSSSSSSSSSNTEAEAVAWMEAATAATLPQAAEEVETTEKAAVFLPYSGDGGGGIHS